MDASWEDVDDDVFLRKSKIDRLDDIRSKANERQLMSLESTRRSLSYLAECEMAGVDAAEELVRNRESLKSASKSLEVISTDMKRSQRHIDSVRNIFSCLKNSLFRRKKHDRNMATIEEDENEDDVKSLDSYLPKRNCMSYSSPWAVYSGRNTSLQGRVLTGDLASSNNPFRSEAVERNLETVSNVVSHLKGMAASMGEEIDFQNSALDLIKEKTVETHMTMAQQQRAIEKMLK